MTPARPDILALDCWLVFQSSSIICRPSQDQHAAHQPAVCSTEAFVGLQRHFQALISAHASDDPQNPSDAAVVGAQRWLDVVDQAANAADAFGKRTLKSSIILLAYYHLFDMHR